MRSKKVINFIIIFLIISLYPGLQAAKQLPIESKKILFEIYIRYLYINRTINEFGIITEIQANSVTMNQCISELINKIQKEEKPDKKLVKYLTRLQLLLTPLIEKSESGNVDQLKLYTSEWMKFESFFNKYQLNH